MKKIIKNILRKNFPTNRRILVEKDLKKISLKNYKKILVVGSGEDPYRYLFGDSVEEYVRFDIEPHDGVTDVVGDILDAPFENDSFDCVFAVEVMEHLKNPFVFASEVKRILSKDGILVITVPFLFHIHADPSDYWRPTRMGLEHLFYDFSDLVIKGQGNRLHVLLDLLSTSYSNNILFRLLRVVNLPINLFYTSGNSTGCSGYLVTAKKK